MQRTTITILSALLIAGSAVQAASASQRHARKVHHGNTYVQNEWNFRGAYGGPYHYYIPPAQEALRERNIQNFGFGGFNRSWPGDWDPALRPSD